jgi:fibronectin-binding autotransporter adhesin
MANELILRNGFISLIGGTITGTVTLNSLANQAAELTVVTINGSNVVGTRELGTNAFTSTVYAPIASPEFTGIVTTPNLTLTSLSMQAAENTALMINGSNVVGMRELGSMAFESTSNYDNYSSWNAAGNSGTPQQILTGDTLTVSGSFGITTVGTNSDILEIKHINNVTPDIASGSSGLIAGSDFTVPSITYDAEGHITTWELNTITLPAVVTHTTYEYKAVTTTGGAFLQLSGSDTSTDNVKLVSAGTTTVSYTSDTEITISSADQFDGTVTLVSGTGTQNGLTLTGAVSGSGNLTLGGNLAINNDDWSGTDLSVANGGTGVSTLTGVVIGSGASALTAVTGTALQLLRRNTGNTAYEFWTPTYISAEVDTLQTVTARASGNTTTLPIIITNATSATSTTTGALKVTGGISTQENLHVGGTANITSDLRIGGDLFVDGTTTSISSSVVQIYDNFIEVNVNPATTNGGLYVRDLVGTASTGSMMYNVTTNTWQAGVKGSETTISLEGHGHGTYDRTTSVLSGANVFSDIIVTDGIVQSAIATRAITKGDIGITPAALTKVDDTNVTLTLGGTPATSLLEATSLTLGWNGDLSVGRGGTGLSSGISGGIPYYSSTTTMASSALLTNNALVIGGGAGSAPSTIAASTTTTHSLFATAGAPAFRAIASGDLPTIPINKGGTNITTYTTGDILYASATNVLSKLAKGANGTVLKMGASVPAWSADTDTGITTLNTLTALTQTFAVGTSGTDFNISSATSTHTFNIPSAGSGITRGLITNGTQSIDGSKQFLTDIKIGAAAENTSTKIAWQGNAAVTTGALRDVATITTTSKIGAHINYAVLNGVNSRTGTIMVTWNGATQPLFTDNSTGDMGDTSGVVFSVVYVNATTVKLQVTTTTSTWDIRTTVSTI